MRIYSAGVLVLRKVTDRVRPITNRHLGLHGAHAFNVRLAIPNGAHVITVRTGNLGLGTTGRQFAYKWLIDGDARGALESTTMPTPSSVEFRGWTYGPDRPASSNGVQVRQDGTVLGTYAADQVRPDVDSRYGIDGQHGFDVMIADIAPGTHEFCVYATNLGASLADPAVQLGCSAQAVQSAPAGP